MIEKIYLGLMAGLFIMSFVIKNLNVYLSTKKPIGGNSKNLSTTFSISTIFYILILSRLTFLKPKWLLEMEIPNHVIKVTGLILVSIGFLTGILSFITMKNSWRIAIMHDQKTELITNGIYKISRNPYFLSYDIFFLGFIFYFPSIILIVLYLSLITVFHFIILEEEKYLKSRHGNLYLSYKKNVNRYLTLKIKGTNTQQAI